MLQARSPSPRSPASATPSSRARAACRTGIYASLNGGVGSSDAPRQGRREPRPHGGRARRRAGRSPHRLPDPFARRGGRRAAVDARERAAARRRHRHPHAGARHRRLHRRLRAGAVRRRAGRRDRRRACRLARRAHRRARSDDRRDGATRRRARAHRGGARPDDPAAELRGRAGIRRALPGRRARTTRVSSRRRRAPATPCSISPAISPTRLAARRHRDRSKISAQCTYAEPERFFSYRRSTHAANPTTAGISTPSRWPSSRVHRHAVA